jgi:tetratricopeptide (TPR) repeat protein
MFYAYSGSITRAALLASEMKERIEADGDDIRYYWLARGGIKRAQGDFETAIADFNRALEITDLYPALYLRARSLLDAARHDEAVATFEELVEFNHLWLDSWAMWGSTAHYYLGRAYEAAGRPDDAAEQYRIFLERWNRADPELVSVADARKRLTRLESES